MDRRRIAVWGLPERIERALRSLAARHEIEVVTSHDSNDAIALILDQGRASSEPQQVAQLAARYAGRPVLLVDGALSPSGGSPRFHARIAPAPEAQTTAQRIVRAALSAHSDYSLSLVGNSRAMRALRAELQLAARAPSTVLLLGETGSGKGVAARALHALSTRAGQPFETVDCAGLAPSLIESELFGHERGAFTGAFERHIGKLERAGAGTLFLDEIGELDVGLQARLLRALEDRVFERVGGREPLPVRARAVAATHRDLHADVASGRFRRDLLYRLDVVRIRVPTLEDRLSDFPALVDHLLARAATRLERPPALASAGLIERLQQRRWPGNVRELANFVEALLVRSPDAELSTVALPEASTPPLLARDGDDEHGALAALLIECGGNVSRVARRLGKPRSTVRSHIARLGLTGLLPRD